MSEFDPYSGGHRWDHERAEMDRLHGFSQPEYGPVGPYLGGDTPYIPPGVSNAEAYLNEQLTADAIWRDREMRNPTDGQASQQDTGNSDGTPHTPQPQEPRDLFVSPAYAPSQTASPSNSRFVPPLAPEPEKEPVKAAPSKDSSLGIAAALIAITAASVLGVVSMQDAEKPQADKQSIGAEDQTFSCAVTGIYEDVESGKATIMLDGPIKGKNIQVFKLDAFTNPTLMQNVLPAGNSPTDFSFASANMHNATLLVRADTTDCTGTFTLGTQKENDEQFIS